MTHVQKMTLPHSLAGKDVLGIGCIARESRFDRFRPQRMRSGVALGGWATATVSVHVRGR